MELLQYVNPEATRQDVQTLRLGLIGYGYWGPLLLRNLTRLSGAHVAMVADLAPQRLAEAARNHPGIVTTTEIDDLLTDAIDAVVIATPLSSHFVLARRALLHGKHVLVEKPLTTSVQEARTLIALAAEKQRILMVGHVYEYSPEVELLRQMVAAGELGRIFTIHSTRLNLGIFRKDANVIWDLAPHDLSIIQYVLGQTPVSISARGDACIREGLIDNAHLDLHYPDGISAHVHVSWLHPNKERRLTIVGDRKMVVYDDLAGNEKIKIYDRGVERPGYAETFSEFQFSYRYGAIAIPHVASVEPLAAECQQFADAIRRGQPPRSHGEVGLQVVATLAAAQESLRRQCATVPVAIVA